ncbi:MAG: methyltransferase [Deltaproteobacteria bacterium]|nr:methyltransferase [Deltaproteobacteria bacterium]
MRADLSPNSNETLDGLACGDLYVLQKRKGYRFSIDAYLLAAFVDEPPGTRTLEIGSGSGIIAILLAGIKGLKITGVEVQREMVNMSRRSVMLNGLENQIEIIEADIKGFEGKGFDIVVTNPPYRPPLTGRLNPDINKAIARHEILLDLGVLLEHSYAALNPGGRFYTIYPVWRMVDLFYSMRAYRIEPKRVVAVYSRRSEEAQLCLVSGIKDGGKDISFDPPFFVYAGANNYTKEMEDVFNNLCISKIH